MGNTTSKLSGKLLKALRSIGVKRLAVTLSLLSMPCLLAACQTTGMSATTNKAICGPWRPITYSAKKDTPATVKQIRTHNRTGANIGCWPR